MRAALLIGEAAEALDASLPADVARERCATLEDAVARAGDLAEPGDVVLLAPACASFDQFENFAERGLAFQRATAALTSERGAR